MKIIACILLMLVSACDDTISRHRTLAVKACIDQKGVPIIDVAGVMVDCRK